MSIENMKMYRNEYNRDVRPWEVIISDFMDEVIITIEDLRQELAKKEDAIDIGDVIKEARLRNG